MRDREAEKALGQLKGAPTTIPPKTDRKITVCLPWNSSFGGGDMYELVPFYYGFDEKGERIFVGYLIKPTGDEKPNYKKMTKAELIELLEANP